MKKTLFFCLLALICGLLIRVFLHRNDWRVPEGAKKARNPLTPSDTVLNAAAPIYKEKCLDCHGEAGKGDGPEAMMYDPSPADFTDAKRMNALTDGQLYFQITEGRKPMPSFKNKLTAEQRWQLVILVRSFGGKSAGSDEKRGAIGKP
jgi:mono/diheme cytochrome c family protein